MIKKCQLMKEAVMEWFADNPGVSQVPAKELMDFFVRKGIFETNKYKGSEVRGLLNRLEQSGNLEMLPHAFPMGTTWYFQRLAGDEIAQNGAIKKTQMLEKAVAEWFAENPGETKVHARNLMDLFMKKEIFATNNNGREVIYLLKQFNKGNLMHMMPHAMLESRGEGSQWFFQRLASDGAPGESAEVRKYSPEVERYRSSLLAGYKD